MTHPTHLGVELQPLGQLVGVGAVSLHAQRERLYALKQEEGAEGALGHAQVTQALHARLEHHGTVGQAHGIARAKRVPVHQPVVPGGGLSEAGEAALGPVEGARVHDDAADGVAVTANPLGAGLHDDVSTVLDGLANIAATSEGVVAHKRNLVFGGKSLQTRKVRDVVLGVTNGLHVYRLGLVINQTFKVVGVVSIHKARLNAHARELHLKLVVCTAVKE
mmetsp:Transcript_38070/g.72986  ORF Transcript_38070/g.72986 Transcript_38070/m.72986 type:complete len:220 (+) Transcript_38070:739-1398(+)